MLVAFLNYRWSLQVFHYLFLFFLYQICQCVIGNLLEKKSFQISNLLTTKTIPKNQTKCHHLHCLNTLHLLGKQMGFALCLEGHQPWALPDQQRKCLLLKIPFCLSPQQMWKKWLLNLGTSLPLALAITTRLILSEAFAQVLKYLRSVWMCLLRLRSSKRTVPWAQTLM